MNLKTEKFLTLKNATIKKYARESFCFHGRFVFIELYYFFTTFTEVIFALIAPVEATVGTFIV